MLIDRTDVALNFAHKIQELLDCKDKITEIIATIVTYVIEFL